MRLRDFYKRYRVWIILLAILLVLFLVVLVPFLMSPSFRAFATDLDGIRATILAYREWAILVFVVLSIITIVLPPVPNDVVPIVGGLLFGFWTALIWALVARIIGSTINYWLGLQIRRGVLVRLFTQEEQARLHRVTERLGWQAVFISRFLPSTDTDLIAYAAGMARMTYWRFILASFFGMLAPVSVTILLGSSLLTNRWLFGALIIFYVLGMLFLPQIIRKLTRHRGR